MSALVETKQGRRVEARIVGGSPGSVYLAGDNHERFTMRRDEIADVDFPGNVVMLGGVALTAFGAYRLWFGDTTCGGLEQAGNCLGAVMPAVAGLLAIRLGAVQLLPVDARVRGQVAAGAGPADAATRAEGAAAAVAAGLEQARSVRRPAALRLKPGVVSADRSAHHDPDIDEPRAGARPPSWWRANAASTR